MKKIEAIDVNIPGPDVKSNGVAYYRLNPTMKEFLENCQDQHNIIGFEYEPGSWNFGVILGTKEAPTDDLPPEPPHKENTSLN
jgi:hypothetical protein